MSYLKGGRLSFIWPTDVRGAKVIQMTLRDKVRIIPLRKTPRYIASVDASFADDRVIVVTCLYEYPELIHLGHETTIREADFPYVPGYLAFREGPVIIEALEVLKIKPDIVLFDGQGIAHPMGLGIASHIGVLTDMPSIGCAKSRLVGEYKEPGFKRGDWSYLKYNGKVIGVVLRTKERVRPVFVSPGHRIDLRASVEIILGCTSKYRIPEPLRRADFISKKLKEELLVKTGQ